MIRPAITLRRKRILIDIDTQKDFFLADGKACVRNHGAVLANIRRVNAWARLKNIRIISTVRVSSPGDTHYGFCLDGTKGQKKLRYTIRAKHLTFEADGCTDLQRDILKNYDQIILHKRCHNPFDEPRADRILSELKGTEFLLIGAGVEDAIKATALGLLARKKYVTILVDAVGSHDKYIAEIALRKMEAKGARLIKTASIVGLSHLHMVGACRCDKCRAKPPKSTLGISA